ncbi:DUF6912 family protein [Granulicoccus sp. GXG6511]|uniref:DUF6912 family protein n=1 Tax=Granulicoccus sp. GXG6511 TaxID=3381351 RepID=UPI003D7CD75B
MKPMVFIPADPTDVGALRDGSSLRPGAAYAATPTLRTTFDYGPDADEDADFAAQLFASLRCLIDGRVRLLLAAEIAQLPAETGEKEFGEVARPEITWRDVRAVFTDDPVSLPAVRAYADTTHGRTLADLWADDATHKFLEHHHLLWFDPTELDQALAGLGAPPANGD